MGDVGKLGRNELLRLIALADRQVNAYDNDRLSRYEPHAGQQRFHSSTKKIRLITSGNRWGKSTASVIEAIWIALGIHPYKRIPTPNRGKLYGESFPVVMETLYPKFREWLPPSALDARKPFSFNQMGYLTGVNYVNGSTTKIGSYDQETSKAEGSDWMYCIEENQTVLMSDGSHKAIKDIVVGDIVAATDGKSQRKFGTVSNVVCNGYRDVIKIVTSGGHSIECTSDHKIFVNYRKYVEAGDVKIGDTINRPLFVDVGSETSISTNDCFLLGAWIGDGWAEENRIFISTASDAFISLFNSKLPDGYSLKPRKRYDYVVCDNLKTKNTHTKNYVLELVKTFGLYGKKAHDKFVPSEIYKQNRERRIEFLRGLYATDGWATLSAIGYGSTSKSLALGVVRLLESLGIKCGIYFKSKQDDKWRDQWFVLITNSFEKLGFINTVGIPTKEDAISKVGTRCEYVLKNQKDVWKDRSGIGSGVLKSVKDGNVLYRKQNFKVKKIEFVGSRKVYDMKVDKYHNFICEGFKVHNCGFDEPPSRDLYIANMRGLVDHGGYMWFSMTPLKERWIYDELWQPGILGEKPYIDCFGGSSDENPYIDKEALQLFMSELTPKERDTRYLGKFAKLMGLVIDTYDPGVSDIEPFELDNDFVLYEGIDPHTSKPHCVLWKAIDKEGYRYACRELKLDTGIYDLGVEIAKVRRELTAGGARLIRSVSDTAINTEDMNKANQYTILKRALIDSGEELMPQLAKKKNWLLPGIEKLRDLFRVVDYGTHRSPSEFLFKNRVPNYRYDLLHYQWPNDISGGDEKPVKAHDDFVDPSRYIESLAPEFKTPGSSQFLRTYNGAYQRR